eukprot:724013-Prorocentrum_minimum.AAC.1
MVGCTWKNTRIFELYSRGRTGTKFVAVSTAVFANEIATFSSFSALGTVRVLLLILGVGVHRMARRTPAREAPPWKAPRFEGTTREVTRRCFATAESRQHRDTPACRAADIVSELCFFNCSTQLNSPRPAFEGFLSNPMNP